jgi:tRNA modification GTPase
MGTDTIAALSSGPGKAGVAVVRVSGPLAGPALRELAGGRPPARHAALRNLIDPATMAVIDRGLVLWFPGPASFTGEDMAELHAHGGRAVVAGVLGALRSLGVRLAEPGEFARRAFENGKLDLTQAEGLADLIDAETEAQRRQAQRQAEGVLGRFYEGWRERLIRAMALVEAAIDFSDEGDVAGDAVRQADEAVKALLGEIHGHLDDSHRGEILREGYCVVLAGAPNVGKSSLLNALARRDAAIVSAEPGTTRDPIEVRLDLGGLPVIVCDTAGLRDAPEGDIEREGMRRALARGHDADLVVWLIDATAPVVEPAAALADGLARLLKVVNKADAAPEAERLAQSLGALAISARSGSGIDRLTDVLAGLAAEAIAPSEAPALTQFRHRAALEDCQFHLRRYLGSPERGAELRAEDLRQAAAALGRITGRVDAEDVIDQVFARFCIGK